MLTGLALALAGISWWAWRRGEHNAKLVTACEHDLYYVSLYDEGVFWNRVCRKCPLHEIVTDQDLIDRLRDGR